MLNVFTWGVELKFTKYASFYRIRKTVGFILDAGFNFKIAIKTKCVDIYHSSKNSNEGYCGKNLK